MVDYLKLFNEELRSGRPADVETPGTEDWYTKGIPQPGQADYRVEGQPEDTGAIPSRATAPAGPQFPWQTPGQPAPSAPIAPMPEPKPGQQIDYTKILTQELGRRDDAELTEHENEKTRSIIDTALKRSQSAYPGGGGLQLLSKGLKNIFGVDFMATNRAAIRNVGGNVLKTVDMFEDVFDERHIKKSLESWDTDPDFQQALRTPEDPDAVPILTRAQFQKHLEARRKPGVVDKLVDKKIFEDTAEEQLRQMDRNFVQQVIEDVARTGQEMVPQVVAYLLGQKVAGKTGGRLSSSLWMGAQIAGPIYQKKVEEGMEPLKAYEQAIASATGQSILESLALGKVMGGKGGLLGRFVQGGLAESATEWLQEYWDLAMDIWYDDEKSEAVFDALQGAWTKGENPFTKEGEIYDKIREDFWNATKGGAYSALIAFPLGAFGGAVSGDADAKDEGLSDEDYDMLKDGEADIDDVTDGQTRKADINGLVDRVYQEAQEPTVIPADPTGELTPEEYFEVEQADAEYFQELDDILNEEMVGVVPGGIEVKKQPTPAAEEGQRPPTQTEKMRYRELRAIKAPTVAEAVEKKKLREKIVADIKRKGFFDVSQQVEVSDDADGPEKVRTPAIRYRGKIYEGQNHLEAYNKLVEDIGGEVPDADFIDGKLEDGFATTRDNFLDRDAGFDLAAETGQLKQGEEFKRGYLVSEALDRDATGEVKQSVDVRAAQKELEAAKKEARRKYGKEVGKGKRKLFQITDMEGYKKALEPAYKKYEQTIKDTAIKQNLVLDDIDWDSFELDMQEDAEWTPVGEPKRIRVTQAQLEELEAAYDSAMEAGAFSIAQDGNKQFIEGDLDGIVNMLRDDYGDFGLETVSASRRRSMLGLADKIEAGKATVISQQVAPKAKKAPAKKAIKPPPLPNKVTPPELPKATEPAAKVKKVIEKKYKGDKFEYHKPQGVLQKALQDFADIVGKGRKLFFYKPTEKYSRVSGFHIGDQVFISDTSGNGWHTFSHETLHDLKTNRRDLYDKLIETITPYIDADVLAGYTNQLNAAMKKLGQDPLSAEAVLEEYIAEYVGIQVRNKSFWRRVREKSTELFDKLATSVMKLIDISGEHWLDKYQDYMFTDADVVRDAIADAMTDYWVEGGIQAKPGKKLGVVEAAKVGYATQNVMQSLDPHVVKSLLTNKALDAESLETLDLLGEASAVDDILGAQLTDQKYFTREFYDKAKVKFEQAKVDLKAKLAGTFKNDKGKLVKINKAKYNEGLAKAKDTWATAQERFKRSKNMSRKKVAEIMTRDERPSFMNITTALKNNKELKKRVDALNKRLQKLSPGSSLYEQDGSFKHHPIEERTKPDPDKVFNVLPKFGGFRRNISQTLVDELSETKREHFRKQIVSWVEEAYRKGIDPKMFGRQLDQLTSKQYPLAPAVRKAHKTLGAINLNAVCPMFNIGNHGCYLDGCYLTGMGAGGNGVNFYRTAAYMGELLQLSNEEIKALNDVGGLRMNGVGDTDAMHAPQYRDVFKHAQMRGLKLKIISKQPAVFEILHKLQQDKDKDVKKKALETVVQPTVDPYWIPITEDDFPGSGANEMQLIQTARKNGASDTLAKQFQELLGREAKVINGQLYRKYGFGWGQLNEMSKKYPKVKTQPRLVVGTFKEIADYALQMPNVIQTWMHAAVRPGMYSEVNGKVLGQGEVGNFTKRVLITFDKGDFKVRATNKDGSIAKSAGTYAALEKFIKSEYTPAEQKKIFNALWGQNKKDPSALCCRAGANNDACMDCSSHCHSGTSYTGTRLAKIAGKGEDLGVFADPDTDPDVIKQELSPEANAVQSELPDTFDKTMKERNVSRSKMGVGKDIGGSVYLHKLYESNIPEIEAAKEKLPDDFDYTIVKWNKANGSITFTKVEDFNTAEEPTVGDQFLVKEDGSTRFMKAQKDPWIYHHKWTMVDDDFKGFDVTQSKLRSLQWTGLKDVDHSRIGKWSFWQENVVPRLGPVGRVSTAPEGQTITQQVSPILRKQAKAKDLQKRGWEPWMQMYTQIPGTKPTYDKLAAWLKKRKIKSILDYSAGLGHGAKVMKAKAFEPFPQKGFDPDWTDPKDIDEKFDFVVNNAVLNVIPGDQRAGVIDHMASVLNEDGELFIQARSRSELIGKVKNPVWVNEKTGEVLTGLRNRVNPETGEKVPVTTYQKGYANNAELGDEIVGQLGQGYKWYPAPSELKLSSPAVIIVKRPDVKQEVDLNSIWYSQMENEIKKDVNDGPAKQVKAKVMSMAKSGRFKQEELDFSGLLEWLDEQKGAVTVDEVVDYLAENHVEISETLLEDSGSFEKLYADKGFANEYVRLAEEWFNDEVASATGESIENYMTEDLEQAFIDYQYDADLAAKEIIDEYLESWEIDTHELNVAAEEALVGREGTTKYKDYTVPGGRQYKELLIQLPKSKDVFYARQHWDDIPNIVAHVRFKTRELNGKRVLFIEEVQSDWHIEGRKRGYRGDGPGIKKLHAELTEAKAKLKAVKDKMFKKWRQQAIDTGVADEAQINRLYRKFDENQVAHAVGMYEEWNSASLYERNVQMDIESFEDDKIADAPFKKTWRQLTLKRMLRYAADNGFDAIAWTDGETQTNRYDLSKHFEKIAYEKIEDPVDGTMYALTGTTPGGQDIDLTPPGGEFMDEKKLEETVGKGLAEKIIAGEGKNPEKYGPNYGEFTGVDLKTRPKWTYHLYDTMLPSDFKKLFKGEQWGKMKAEQLEMHNPNSSPWIVRSPLGSEQSYRSEEEADNAVKFWKSRYPESEWSKISKIQQGESVTNGEAANIKYWSADLSPEAKSKASTEGMMMFNLDIGSEIDPETEALLREKVGREDKSIATRIKDSFDEFWKNKTTRIVDRMHPIKEKLGGEGTAYMLHRGLPGVQSTLNAFMAHGKLAWDASKALITKQRHKGFLPWVKSLGVDAEKSFYWIMAKRAEALDKEGREHWLTKPVRDQIFKWVGDPTGDKSWEQINEEFQEFNRNILDVAIDAGLLTKEQTNEWMNDFYIPFYRVLEDETSRLEYLKGPAKGKENLSARVRRLQGAEAKIGDPFENILKNWSHLVSESMANVARGEAYAYGMDNKVMSGLSRIDEDGNEVPVPLLEQVSWADTVVFKPGGEGGTTFVHKKTGDEILSFKDKGQTVFFKVNDPELFQALSLVNRPYVDNILMKALSGSKRALTYGATFGPAFRVANMLRDTLHTFQITEGWNFKPLFSTAKGFISAWREDADFVEFMSSGHAFGGSYVKAEDPKALEKYVKRIAKADQVSLETAAKRVLDTPKKMLSWWERIGEASENAARVSLYTNLKKEGKTHLEAAFAARDLMDFQMSGNSNVVGFLIGTVPFLNARMQGLYRMGRAAVENPKTFFFKGAMIWAATMALWLNNKDDERYKALEDWDKFAYYHFWIGDKHYRIPKPFETGVVFSTAWEAMADTAVGNEEADHLLTFTKHALGETFAFNPIPQGVRPLAEQWANKSFFTGRPIESQFQQKLKPGERYDPWTSETLILAGKLGIPPKRAEALIRGYFSDVGMGILTASDLAVRTFGDFPDRPAKRIDEYPMIGRFVKEAEPARNVKYMTKFWDAMGELDKLVNTVNMYKNSGDMEGAQKIGDKNRKLLQMQKGLNRQRQRIRKISYEVKRIWKDPALDGDQKRQMIDQLTAERNKLVEEIYKRYLKEI